MKKTQAQKITFVTLEQLKENSFAKKVQKIAFFKNPMVNFTIFGSDSFLFRFNTAVKCSLIVTKINHTLFNKK